MTARQLVMQTYPRAKAAKVDCGYEIRNPTGDDCRERAYTVLSDDPLPTAAEAWRAAAELELLAEQVDP